MAHPSPTTRRSFLRGAALAAPILAAPVAILSPHLGEARPVPQPVNPDIAEYRRVSARIAELDAEISSYSAGWRKVRESDLPDYEGRWDARRAEFNELCFRKSELMWRIFEAALAADGMIAEGNVA